MFTALQGCTVSPEPQTAKINEMGEYDELFDTFDIDLGDGSRLRIDCRYEKPYYIEFIFPVEGTEIDGTFAENSWLFENVQGDWKSTVQTSLLAGERVVEYYESISDFSRETIPTRSLYLFDNDLDGLWDEASAEGKRVNLD